MGGGQGVAGVSYQAQFGHNYFDAAVTELLHYYVDLKIYKVTFQ